MSLKEYGWTSFFSDPFEVYRDQGLLPGRVVLEGRGGYLLHSGEGEVNASTTGRLKHRADGAGDLPAIGDWVAFAPPLHAGKATIRAVLPRKSKLSRKVAGPRAEEQMVAANMDIVFLVMGLDGNYSLRRMERMLTMAWESGALPVVVLNKKDLCTDPASRQREVETVAPGVSVLMLSAFEDSGLAQIRSFLREGETVALVGSSGVGKSTLINRLMKREMMPTQQVRAKDDHGRHTTTHRALFKLPEGGLLIDNPGIRELQLWSLPDALREAFEDIDALAAGCRFRDCSHEREPGCAVAAAVEQGALPSERLASFRSLEKELRHLALKQDQGLERAEKKKWKAIHKTMRTHYKNRPR